MFIEVFRELCYYFGWLVVIFIVIVVLVGFFVGILMFVCIQGVVLGKEQVVVILKVDVVVDIGGVVVDFDEVI